MSKYNDRLLKYYPSKRYTAFQSLQHPSMKFFSSSRKYNKCDPAVIHPNQFAFEEGYYSEEEIRAEIIKECKTINILSIYSSIIPNNFWMIVMLLHDMNVAVGGNLEPSPIEHTDFYTPMCQSAFTSTPNVQSDGSKLSNNSSLMNLSSLYSKTLTVKSMTEIFAKFQSHNINSNDEEVKSCEPSEYFQKDSRKVKDKNSFGKRCTIM